MSGKSQVKNREHQNNANIYHQSSPEVISEKQDIDADYGGGHHRYVQRDNCLVVHFVTSNC
jgi:hypothetical protein